MTQKTLNTNLYKQQNKIKIWYFQNKECVSRINYDSKQVNFITIHSQCDLLQSKYLYIMNGQVCQNSYIEMN